MGWSTKETRAESKMLQEVYGQTARKKLNVTMSTTNINESIFFILCIFY